MERVESRRPEARYSGVYRMRYQDGINAGWRLVILGRNSTLGAAISSTTTTTITVATAALTAAKGDLLIVDSELMEVASGEGTTSLTVTRGRHDTAAATHTNGATIRRASLLNIDSVVNVGGRNHWLDVATQEVK